MMLYRFVDAQKVEGFPVRLVCSVVGVSPVGVLRLQAPAPVWSGSAGRGRPGGRDRGHLDRVGWDLWFASGVRRAASAWAGGEP